MNTHLCPLPANIRTRQLSQYCTSFLLDDMLRQQDDSDPVELGFSLSQWKQATDALAFLVRTVAQYNSSGVDVEFSSARAGLKAIHDLDMDALYESKCDPISVSNTNANTDSDPERCLGLGNQLGEIIKRYMATLLVYPIPKPLNLIIIVPPCPSQLDVEQVEDIITSTAGHLDAMNAPPNQIGIHFIVIGETSNWMASANFFATLSDLRNFEPLRRSTRQAMVHIPYNADDTGIWTPTSLIDSLVDGVRRWTTSAGKPLYVKYMRTNVVPAGSQIRRKPSVLHDA